MSKIRILPELLANRIAAGEVVERPASVVKELIENSLDAKADRIEVEIEGGGTRLIRVVDNGEGMDEDDILLCFERHGTSKISEVHDLVAISTLGFRGEAIPSIASVAKMSITSRPKNSELGTKVNFEYGRLQKVHETGCSQGTIIEIRNLFGKTPARRKFLRTVRTELGHIEEVIKNYALACPLVSFSLRINGKESIYLDGSQTLEMRLSNILNYRGSFIPIGKEINNSGKRQIHGYLIPPEQTAPGNTKLRLFINGRAVKDRIISHGIIEGLRGFLLKGHSPAGYIHLVLPPEEIDVNVHPAKNEVRFHNISDIHQYIKQNVESAMFDHQQTVRADFFRPSDTLSPVREENDSFEHHDVRSKSASVAAASDKYTISPQAEQRNIWQKLTTSEIPLQPHVNHQAHSLQTSEPPPSANQQVDDELFETEARRTDQKGHGMRVIGQFKNLYIFCQAGDKLVTIDQHAAHERLLYEKFRAQYVSNKVASQALMFPETLELSPFQIQIIENNLDDIEKMGFSISEFGGNSYIISAVPALAGQCNGSELFLDLLEGFGKQGNSSSNSGRLDNILATMACKAAIKSGYELTTSEIDGLLDQMANADLFSHCPHGRPVIKSFSSDEIKKWFHRT